MTTYEKITHTIRSMAQSLLETGKVDAVIGFRQGSLPYLPEACIATTPEQASELIFNSHCRMNLSVYLTPERFTGSAGKVAIVAKGCDSRNIVTQIQENRFSREQVHIIGVPCSGVADKSRVAIADRITAISEQENTLTIISELGETVLSKAETLQDNCRTCIARNPVVYDELAGNSVEELTLGTERFADVEEIASKSPEEKEALFRDLVSSCTRCYACRNACPLCYCPTCFVDESTPQLADKTVDSADVMTYHLVRAFHGAGRCTDCGACEAACPMDIKIRHFTRKTIRDVKAAYGSDTGMDLAVRPPLDRFDLKDPESFIQ